MFVAECLFKSFLQAGFECSTHKLKDGRRLDLLSSTRHDRFACNDYQLLKRLDIHTIRIAARWHLIEPSPGTFNFQSLDRTLDAAAAEGMEVLLDLLHFGWPDYLDIFDPSFVPAFARFTRAVLRHLRTRAETLLFFAPVNEISYISWAGGDEAYMNPFAVSRGHELKSILIRAAVAAADIILQEIPAARLFWPEPVIHIAGNPEIPGDDRAAHDHTMAQYQVWDMLSGRLQPELGGHPRYLDLIGVNFYSHNQWVHNDRTLHRADPQYNPFHRILNDVWERYRRPLFVSETGTENEDRPAWFNYVCDEAVSAVENGVPVHGICLYPILNHPGWVDDRHCENGLFSYADVYGNRTAYQPLAQAILHQQLRFSKVKRKNDDSQQYRLNLSFAS